MALGIDQHFNGENGFTSFSAEMTWIHGKLQELSSKKLRTAQEALDRLYCTLKLRHMRRILVDYLVKHVIKPFGIPRGSEKQGGQHQGSNAPVYWPVDFVTAMVVDGKV
jgi:hypothetical protein